MHKFIGSTLFGLAVAIAANNIFWGMAAVSFAFLLDWIISDGAHTIAQAITEAKK